MKATATEVDSAAVVQAEGQPWEPIPAEPPLDGPLWTLVVPALLFVIALLATVGLYRRFARE